MHWTQTPNGRKKMRQIMLDRKARKESTAFQSHEFGSSVQSIDPPPVPEIWQLIENLEHEIQEKQQVLAYLRNVVK